MNWLLETMGRRYIGSLLDGLGKPNADFVMIGGEEQNINWVESLL